MIIYEDIHDGRFPSKKLRVVTGRAQGTTSEARFIVPGGNLKCKPNSSVRPGTRSDAWSSVCILQITEASVGTSARDFCNTSLHRGITTELHSGSKQGEHR